VIWICWRWNKLKLKLHHQLSHQNSNAPPQLQLWRHVNRAESSFTSFPPNIFLSHMASSLDSIMPDTPSLFLLWDLYIDPLSRHIHPEDGNYNVCQNAETGSTYDTAKFRKLKLHNVCMFSHHNINLFQYLPTLRVVTLLEDMHLHMIIFKIRRSD
jgi:hypothetical protein